MNQSKDLFLSQLALRLITIFCKQKVFALLGSAREQKLLVERWCQFSPTFFEQLFHAKVICTAFLYSQFGFVFYWQKNISKKAARWRNRPLQVKILIILISEDKK